ncbi:MAG: dephospho-CoA kinase [Burkholderiaceae bacterium]
MVRPALKRAYFSVGLTGGVGSGKSTIAGMLLRHGAGVIDADAIAHELTQPDGAAIAGIRQTFGEAAIAANGALDRAWMRARAFTDPAARKALERLLHPLIREASNRHAEEHAGAGSPYVVFVIPLLVESGDARDRFDRVLVVDCSEATQIARVCARPGIDAQVARAILAAQATRAQRLAAADDVLFNEAPLDEISARVEILHQRYVEQAEASARASV